MTTCCPDISFSTIECPQSSAVPVPVNYKVAKHIMQHLYATQDDDIYFWRTTPGPDFPDLPVPPVPSNHTNPLTTSHPKHHALESHGYVDSDWANCIHTRRSFSGICLHLPLPEGTTSCKAKFQLTAANSSTEP